LRDLLRAEGTKDENRLKLLHTIMARPGTQAYLSRRSGLSPGTVSDAVRDLAAKGFVVVADKDGRSKPVTIAKTTGAAVGIELGFRYSAVVTRRADQRREESEVRRCSVGAAAGTERWVAEVADAVQEAVDNLGEEDIAAIGLGVPRVVNPPDAALVPPALPPWKQGDNPAQLLAGELSNRTSGPRLVAPHVVLDNDANLAAYAHSIYEFDTAETLIGIKASTGIGAGIIIAGQIFRGARGVAGEIGHVVVQPGGAFCSCGGRGCLESLVGADALLEQAKTTLGHRRLTPPKDLEELVQWAHGGNVTCQRVLREAGETLGFAVGNLCNILSPNVVVVSGAISREAADFTMKPLAAAVERSAMRATFEKDAKGRDGVTVMATKMDHPAAHGALVVALEGTKYEPASRGAARSSRNRSR
jgi:predicted NBD/HSP70 family sugar kinase